MLTLLLPWQFYYIFHIVWSSLITGYADAPPDEAQHTVGLVSNPRGMHHHLRSSVTMGCRYFTWASSCCWFEVWGCYLLFSFLQQLVVTGYYRAPLEAGVTFQCCFHSSIARYGLVACAVSTLLQHAVALSQELFPLFYNLWPCSCSRCCFHSSIACCGLVTCGLVAGAVPSLL